MSAREPSAVEVIAEAVPHHEGCTGWTLGEPSCCWCEDYRRGIAEAVLAAIRAMTPEQQAELIGGEVERASFDRDGSFYRLAADAEDEKHLLTYGGTIKARVVSGWRLSEVQP